MKIIGIDNDGALICESGGTTYNCGETPEQFGWHNLSADEAQMLWLLGPRP